MEGRQLVRRGWGHREFQAVAPVGLMHVFEVLLTTEGRLGWVHFPSRTGRCSLEAVVVDGATSDSQMAVGRAAELVGMPRHL